MEIQVLCSGSKGNCTFIRAGETSLLIDVGMTSKKYLTQSLEQVNCSIDQLDGVLVTHSHSDHVKQLKSVAHLPIYSWCALDCSRLSIPAGLSSHYELLPWHTYKIKDVLVKTIGLSHDAGKTLGFLIEYNQEKLAYITDTGFLRQDAFPILQNADWYIFESNHDPGLLEMTNRPWSLKQRILSEQGHMDNEYASRCLSHLVGDKTKTICLAHLSDEANDPCLALQVLEQNLSSKGINSEAIRCLCAKQSEVVTISQ